jgi:predicted secreted protein
MTLSWLEAGLVFVVSWWLLLFMVLPWGVRREDNPVRGQDPGAPANPRLALKFAVTTVLALLVTVVADLIAGAGIVSFRP